jgi:uncharacterized protein with HEPN domain
MLSEIDRDGLSDILFNIHLANSFAQGFDYEHFLADMRTFTLSRVALRSSRKLRAACLPN